MIYHSLFEIWYISFYFDVIKILNGIMKHCISIFQKLKQALQGTKDGGASKQPVHMTYSGGSQSTVSDSESQQASRHCNMSGGQLLNGAYVGGSGGLKRTLSHSDDEHLDDEEKRLRNLQRNR